MIDIKINFSKIGEAAMAVTSFIAHGFLGELDSFNICSSKNTSSHITIPDRKGPTLPIFIIGESSGYGDIEICPSVESRPVVP